MHSDSDRAAVLCGLGGFVPPNTVTNDDLCRTLDTTDEWIFSRTGIRRRHVAGSSVATGDLALEAAVRALRSMDDGMHRPIELVVLATTTPDFRCPATAPWVADQLGLGAVPAFDVSAVCSGFIYGLSVAAAFVTSGMVDTALVIGADKFTSILDPVDRTTRPIFGDGAGAVVLRAGTGHEAGAFHAFDLGSDGRYADLISVPVGGSRFSSGSSVANGLSPYFSMAGKTVYRKAIEHMTESSRRVLLSSDWPTESVDWVVGHQANGRILRALGEALNLPSDHVVNNIEDIGNTSAASIPLALCDAARGRMHENDHVLLTAFGGGLTWGASTLTWPEISVEAIGGDTNLQEVAS